VPVGHSIRTTRTAQTPLRPACPNAKMPAEHLRIAMPITQGHRIDLRQLAVDRAASRT
jgi:hypothetical protein